MKPELKQIGLALGLGVLAATLSSCSLLGKNRATAKWEIESDVPASLNSGRATTPAPEALAGAKVKSNLDGLSPIGESSLELPALENGMMADIPKPSGIYGQVAEQSPPEMLSIPPTEGAGDLPNATGAGHGLDTLLPAPPPVVTEEELAMAPAALTAAEAHTPAPPTELTLSPAPDTAPTAHATAPSIPLLYGKLDLAPFLTPPAPLAANTPLLPAAQ